MADLNREDLRRLARLGARARLEELRREEAAIRQAFPDLFGASRGRPRGQQPSGDGAAGGGALPRRRRRRRMSAAARKAASERMKKYWAELNAKGGRAGK